MTLARKVEVVSGVMTGLLGFLPYPLKYSATEIVFTLWPNLLGDALVLFIVPGLLVAIGSFIHCVGRKTWGFVLVVVGGTFLTFMMFIHIFGGVFYVFGLLAGVIILSQSLMAILTMIWSLVVGKPSAGS